MPPKKRRKIQKSHKRKLFSGNRSTSLHSDDSIKAAEEIREILEKANVIPSGEYALNHTLKIREEDVYFTPIRTVTLGGRRKTKRKNIEEKEKQEEKGNEKEKLKDEEDN